MRLFECGNCGNIVYFENTVCERCSSRLGYLADKAIVAALEPASEPDIWAVAEVPDQAFRFCANAQYGSCNWLVPATEDSEPAFCLACRHNRTIPDLSIAGNLSNWRRYESAKHRLFYTLLDLHLPMTSRAEDPENGLAFDFLAETPQEPTVITGHDHGLITLNLKEADDVQRVQQRCQLNEHYRTLLGHLRHESGHYAWTRLVTGDQLQRFREVFGDETQDYAEALRTHYAKPASDEWRSNFISAYAASHPWEDFAETWAHYLHMIDTMEMAADMGLRLQSRTGSPPLALVAHSRPAGQAGFREFVHDWRLQTIAMNSFNQCMGEADAYPFVLPAAVVSKLEFIHLLVNKGVADLDTELLLSSSGEAQ